MIKAREKWEVLRKEASKYRGCVRYGQSLMLALQKIDLPLYEKIAGSVDDCFYDDEKCTSFAVEVMAAWCENGIMDEDE